jgi:hypothetical protein
VARYLDAYLQYYSPNFIVIKGQGGLAYKYDGVYHSIEETIEALNK